MTVVVVIMAGVPTPARAGGRGDPIPGDFNADSLQDEAVLGAVMPNLCSTVTEYGSAPGMFLPPIVHVYLTPDGLGTPNSATVYITLSRHTG